MAGLPGTRCLLPKVFLTECQDTSDGNYTRLKPEENGSGQETTGTHEMMMELSRSRSGESEP